MGNRRYFEANQIVDFKGQICHFTLKDFLGDEKEVQIYAKFVLATSQTSGLKTIVVSFHEAERPLSYYFQ